MRAGCLLQAALPRTQHQSPIWCLLELSSVTVTSTWGKETACSQNEMTNEDNERNMLCFQILDNTSRKPKTGSVTAGKHQ